MIFQEHVSPVVTTRPSEVKKNVDILQEIKIKQYSKYNIDWSITQACNFSCTYCHVDKVVANEEVNIDFLEDFLNKTGQTWTITISGGEPTIHPKFIEICQRLTKNHFIAINTNLTYTPAVEKLCENINPKRVKVLDISLHKSQRDIKDPHYSKFLKNLELIKSNGFNFNVNYVLHPSLIPQVQEDISYFKSIGIDLLVKRIKGVFNNTYYPLSYSQSEKTIIKRHFEFSNNRLDYDYRGIQCSAGINLLKIRSNGDVYRCPGDKTSTAYLGNINQGKLKLLKDELQCNVGKCPCWGSTVVSLTPEQRLMREAIDYYVEGSYNESLDVYDKVINQYNNPIAMNNSAAIYKEIGKDKLAKEFISMAIKNFQKNFIIKLNAYKQSLIDETHFDLSALNDEKQTILKQLAGESPNLFTMSRQIITQSDLLENRNKNQIKDLILQVTNKNKVARSTLNYILQTKIGNRILTLWKKI